MNKNDPLFKTICKIFTDQKGELTFFYGFSARCSEVNVIDNRLAVRRSSIFDPETHLIRKYRNVIGTVLIDLLEFMNNKEAIANTIYRACQNVNSGGKVLIGIHNDKHSLLNMIFSLEDHFKHYYGCNINPQILGDSYIFENPFYIMNMTNGPAFIHDHYITADLVDEETVTKAMWMANINDITRIEDVYIPKMTLFIGSL